MADKVATFSLNIAGNAADTAKEATAELEAFRAKIEASQTALKGMSGSLRALKGSSDEVTKAKSDLKAQIDAEKGALSRATLEVVKQGTSYEQLTAQMRKAEAGQRKLDAKKQAEDLKRIAEGAGKVKAGFSAAGGPLAEFSGKLDTLKGIAGGANGGMGLLALGAGVLVAGVVALTVAVVDAGIKLGKFIVTGADALRSMNLMREAASGSAENAKNLGTQVDRIARIVPTAKAEINALAVAMTRDMSGGLSKATGPTIVAGIEAVSVATAAAGEKVGGTFKDLVERGKRFGRFWLSPQDLDATGLRFTDVAESLAKRLHVSLEKAKDVLFRGGAGMAVGVGAFKDAINIRFGQVNTEKLLSFDVQVAKLQDNLTALTKGVVLEPLLKGMGAILAKFSDTTVTGQHLQKVVTKIGDALVSFAVNHVDDLVKGIETMVIWAGKGADMIKGMGAALDNPVFGVALKGLEVTLGVVGGLIAAAGAVLLGFGLVVGGIWVGFEKLGEYAFKAFDYVASIKWGDLGKGIIQGLIGGLEKGGQAVVDAVKNLATKIKDKFKAMLGIASPSTVFAAYGKDTGVGYAGGVDASAPEVQRATEAMVPEAPTRRAGGFALGSGASGGAPVIHFTLQVHGGKGEPEEIAKAVTSPNVLRELSRCVREAMISQGVPTQSPVAA